MRLANAFLVSVFAAIVAACSASSESPDTSSSSTASASSSSASSSSGTGGSVPNGCNGLANAAPMIQPQDVVEDPPVPMGGTIADGTYFETAETHYAQAKAGPTGELRATMLVVTGTTWKLVTTKDGVPNYESNELVAPMGVELHDQVTCPGTGTVLGNQYTATADELRVYRMFGDKPLVEHVYARQP